MSRPGRRLFRPPVPPPAAIPEAEAARLHWVALRRWADRYTFAAEMQPENQGLQLTATKFRESALRAHASLVETRCEGTGGRHGR